MRTNRTIIVIGAGVSGITTALTLQLFGYNTIIYARQQVDEATDDPRFASLYPAASIIPHSIQSSHLDELFPASQPIFNFLNGQNDVPVSVHRHFEIFESPKNLPEYTKYLHNLLPMDELNPMAIPQRGNAPQLSGWRFDCFITQWPKYMCWLYDLYAQVGGEIQKKEIKRADIESLPAQIIVNCSGLGSIKLFENLVGNPIITRGHLVHVFNQKPSPKSSNFPVSYNYTPGTKIYATPDGQPSDVYFYPIGNRWILGGSRQTGSLNKNHRWEGKSHQHSISIDGTSVPRAVLKLNAKILEHTFGISFETDSEMSAFIGYRYTPKKGLQLESTQQYEKRIIHNYGHGGAGVTISWGCALKVLSLLNTSKITREVELNNSSNSKIISDLQRQLQKVYLEVL